MQPDVRIEDLRSRSAAALGDPFLRGAVGFTVDRLRASKAYKGPIVVGKDLERIAVK